MSYTDPQETATLEHLVGISATPPPVTTHLTLATADPEAGLNITTITRIAAGTWNTNPTQVSGRRQVRNTGTRVFTNTTASPITPTHVVGMTALTGGASTFAALLSGTPPTLAPGDTLTIAENALTVDLG